MKTTTSNTEYYGNENPWESDMSETPEEVNPALPNVGDNITVLYQACHTSEFGYETDWEAYVDLTVTAEMLDSWQKWGAEYKTFEDMVLKVHDDEVREALEVEK